MKKFTMLLLSAIFVALIAGSIQSISADHESSEGIFKDKSEVNLVTTQDSDYQVYLQAVLRNGDGQLINVTENTKTAAYIPHEIADYVFDTLMGEKEIVTIDNIKYEKVQYTFTPTFKQRWIGLYQINPEPVVNLIMEVDDLKQAKMKHKHYSIWKIHGCWDLSNIGHPGVQCLPIFQVLVPTMVLEADDTVTNQWTILRELS